MKSLIAPSDSGIFLVNLSESLAVEGHGNISLYGNMGND